MAERVTVVVPSYNTSSWAERAVRSVLEQDVPDARVLIVDDASKPEHAAALDALAEHPRVRVLHQEVNGGALAARRHGWEAADTELVAFLDDDDRYLPGYLETCLSVFSSQPGISAVHTRYWWVTPEGERLKQRPIRGNEGMIFRREVERGTVKMSTLMVRRGALLDLERFFDQYRTSETLAIVLRVAHCHRFAFVEEPLVEVTDRAGSLSSNIRFHYRAEILEHLLGTLEGLDASTRRLMMRKAAKYYRKAGRRAMRSGDVDQARRYFGRGLRMHPSPPTLLGYLSSLARRHSPARPPE